MKFRSDISQEIVDEVDLSQNQKMVDSIPADQSIDFDKASQVYSVDDKSPERHVSSKVSNLNTNS